MKLERLIMNSTYGIRSVQKIHTLKTIDPFFQEMYDGLKKFEVRKNDRDFQSGELLNLIEYPVNESNLRQCLFRIGSVLSNSDCIYDAIQNDYVVLGLDDYDFEVVYDSFKVGEEVVDKNGNNRIIGYVLSNNKFPEGIKEGYAVVCFKD